jgi:hypothetical protein
LQVSAHAPFEQTWSVPQVRPGARFVEVSRQVWTPVRHEVVPATQALVLVEHATPATHPARYDRIAARVRCATARSGVRVPPPGLRSVGNIIVALFAILLCLINAIVWTFVSDMPLAGVGWVLADAFCFYLQKWSQN